MNPDPNSRPQCLWITNAPLGTSETFLQQSLDNLNVLCDVQAVSLARPPANPHPDIQFDILGFYSFPGMTLINRAIRKIKVLLGWSKLPTKLDKARDGMTRLLEKPFDFAWIHYGTTTPFVCPTLIESDTPYFIQVHGYDVSKAFANPEYKSQFVAFANRSEGVVCSSHHVKRLCILAGVRAEIPVVIPNALNIERFTSIDVEKTAHPSFVHFGRLTQKKNPLATLHAFRIVQESIPEATLTFIGGGHLLDELKQTAENYEIQDKVTFTGALPQSEAIPIVAKHWVFCQHSVTSIEGDQEGFANSPAEAALMKMPVVSTYHNGIPEHVIDGETGLLVKEFDFEHMADCMIELATNPTLRGIFGSNGQNSISQLCAPSRRIHDLAELLNSTDLIQD